VERVDLPQRQLTLLPEAWCYLREGIPVAGIVLAMAVNVEGMPVYIYVDSSRRPMLCNPLRSQFLHGFLKAPTISAPLFVAIFANPMKKSDLRLK
jgi:hypothetical protein